MLEKQLNCILIGNIPTQIVLRLAFKQYLQIAIMTIEEEEKNADDSKQRNYFL